VPNIAAAGRLLEYAWIGESRARAGSPALVFLHEGLGSIRQWRDFPQRLCDACGLRGLVYDRYGYGQSDVLAEPRVALDFMHREALESLPGLLAGLRLEAPVLVGHSDGASIALIHAGGGHPARAVVAMAPHVFVEDISVRSIERARRQFETTDLRERLRKYHRDPDKTFHLWNDAWLDPDFRRWNIEEYLPKLRCPLLAIQGADDEYGTLAQLEAIARQAGGPCELLELPACGHAPFRDQPEIVLDAIAKFIGRTNANNPSR
jgi:pimeloyl-ACP methyl ester carboxylesterase